MLERRRGRERERERERGGRESTGISTVVNNVALSHSKGMTVFYLISSPNTTLIHHPSVQD